MKNISNLKFSTKVGASIKYKLRDDTFYPPPLKMELHMETYFWAGDASLLDFNQCYDNGDNIISQCH